MQNKNRVGRPKIEGKRVTLAVRVTPEVHKWISDQEMSAGRVIEKLVLDVKNKQMDMFEE